MEDFEMLQNSSGEIVFLNDLLNSLKNHDIKRFQDILKNENDINLDHYFGDPDLGTLLDIGCIKSGYHLFVNLLLTHGANPNIVNRIRKKAPIHFAVQNSDLLTLRGLLDCDKTDINILDSTGSCALHYAVKLPNLEILEMLLACDKIDLNIVNKKGKSPILCALEGKNPNKNCIETLLNHDKLNLNDDPKFSMIKESLNKLIPEWEESYIVKDSKPSEDISFSHAFSLLRNGNSDEFINVIKKKKNDSTFLEGNNGSHTFLQYCCEFGISKVVFELLQVNVNPNNTSSTIIKTPLMIAAYKGYVEIVRMLINNGKCSFNPIEKETVIHSVVKGSSECVDLIESDSERDHLQCLSLLLTVSRSNLNINQGDFKGNTGLHYATKQGDNEMVLLLLKAGASLSCFNFLNEPAFADINYKTLKKYLDSCVYTNDKLPREESFEIILNYGCLRPIDSADSFNNKSESTYVESRTDKSYNTFECKSLLYLSHNNELKHLLKHPIFTSFLYLKWRKIYKGFYVNLLFYFLFLITMTVHILFIYPNITSDAKKTMPVYWILLVFIPVAILMLRELTQFIISPLKYLMSPENWLEIGIIYTSINVLFFAQNTPFEEKVKLSVIIIMFSWGELVLLIGRHPALSTYIEMLKTVSWNFLKFLAWYFALIIAFSLSFYILFGMDRCSYPDKMTTDCTSKNETDDDDFFSTPGVSLFKTIIMLTGEFDASSVPFVTHPGLSHALFIAFLFFIAIVLFNLLNGLAVSDTQAIQADSELVSYISRVKLIAYVETLVSNPLPNKESVFNLNLSSCWETSFITYCKNKMISKYINLFQDGCLSDDYEIRILPFYGNQIQMSNAKYATNRKELEINSKCYKKCGFTEMDSTVIHSIKEVLLEKHVELEIVAAERKKEENERMLLEMVKNCYKTLNRLQETVNGNKEKLDRIVNGNQNI